MSSWLGGALATSRFEIARSFTIQRNGIFAVLTLFPPAMVTLILGASQFTGQGAANGGDILNLIPFLIVFLTSLVLLLAMLLWATPNVYSELEGKTWIFLASRPSGRISLFLGKYLTAIFFSYAIAMIATSLSIAVADRMLMLEDPGRLWLSLAGIYGLACVGYGAIFSAMGTIFFKRSMVVAAGYLIGSEVFLASVPALIGKLTLRYHLQELGIRWIGFFLPVDNEPEYRLMYGPAWPLWGNLLVILIVTALGLMIGLIVVTNRQYITSEEN